jgi:hypothetical protein
MCGGEKPLVDFASAGIVKGVQYYRHLCTSCYTVSKKPRKRAMRERYYEFKKGLKCARCGFDDYRALQFHHIKGDKEHAVANMLRRGHAMEAIIKEASKCEVICANCHQIEHIRSIA